MISAPFLPMKEANRRISTLERRLAREVELRLEAERQTTKMHALLITERVRNLKHTAAAASQSSGWARETAAEGA